MCIHGDWLNEWIVIFPFSKPFGWVYAIRFSFFCSAEINSHPYTHYWHTILLHECLLSVHDIPESFVCNWLLCHCLRLRCNNFAIVLCVNRRRKNGDFGFHLVREIFWATIKVNKSIVLSRVCDWKRRRTSQFCIHRNSDRQQYRCLDNEWAMNCNGAAGEHKPTEFSFFIDCLTIESCISHREKERHPTAWTL